MTTNALQDAHDDQREPRFAVAVVHQLVDLVHRVVERAISFPRLEPAGLAEQPAQLSLARRGVDSGSVTSAAARRESPPPGSRAPQTRPARRRPGEWSPSKRSIGRLDDVD